MSTKQVVIFSFMIVLLGVMLYALGSFIYWSTELASKKQTVEVLENKIVELRLVLDGTPDHPGLVKVIDDPERGLKGQFESWHRMAVDKEGNREGGAEQRRILYEEKEKALEQVQGKCVTENEKTTWTPGSSTGKWKAFYDKWAADNKGIAAALARLAKDKKEKDEKVAAAEVELEQELKNEETTRTKSVADRKDMEKELTQVRAQHEEVADKVENVTRESQTTSKPVKQGEIIFVAADLKKVNLNVGAGEGLRKGLRFGIYSKVHLVPFKKGSLEITDVRASSSEAVLLPPKQDIMWDPITGWVAPDPKMRYSIFAAAGQDETDAAPLEKPKSRADRIEDYRLIKEFGEEKAKDIIAEREKPTTPPYQIGAAFAPIVAGDWIYCPDFVPLVPETAYQKQSVAELLTMGDVNVTPVTFYFTDTLSTYKADFLKRLCERNQCKVVEAMSADVNYLVTSPGTTRIDLVHDMIDPYKDKGDEVSAEIKKMRKTESALIEAKKLGATVMGDDEVESFFARRHRKMELLRGKTIQPGQHVFFIAGETRIRSAEHLKKYIAEHGGVVANELDGTVDYVVVGTGLEKKFYDETIKAKGLKVIREDELPRFFGLE